METRVETVQRSPLTVLLAALLALGVAKGAARLLGFAVLLAVVAASVGALTVGVLLLKVLLLR